MGFSSKHMCMLAHGFLLNTSPSVLPIIAHHVLCSEAFSLFNHAPVGGEGEPKATAWREMEGPRPKGHSNEFHPGTRCLCGRPHTLRKTPSSGKMKRTGPVAFGLPQTDPGPSCLWSSCDLLVFPCSVRASSGLQHLLRQGSVPFGIGAWLAGWETSFMQSLSIPFEAGHDMEACLCTQLGEEKR